MLSIIKTIESIIRWIGEKSSYINVLLVMIICIDVFMRYILNTTQTWVIELEWHLFALIFLLGASYTLQEDQHVRVLPERNPAAAPPRPVWGGQRRV